MDREGQFYDLMAYIASCAKDLHANPELSAPMYLLLVLNRMLDILYGDPALDQAFLGDTKALLLRCRSLLLENSGGAEEALAELTMKIAAKSIA